MSEVPLLGLPPASQANGDHNLLDRRKLTYGTGNKVGVQLVVTSSLTSSKPKLEKAVLIASSADGWSEAEEMAY